VSRAGELWDGITGTYEAISVERQLHG
jgi:hypothetical protein